MRVLQIIDSLDAGGAERMAVNYANELHKKMVYCALVVTRKEGTLKNQLHTDIPYFFLNKKSTFDIKAIVLLHKIIKNNKIEVLHAHSSSFFIAVVVKVLLLFKVKIIYHEHHGNKVNEPFYKNIPLIFSFCFFSKILVVNHQLQQWFLTMGTNKAIYFANFAALNKNQKKETVLDGYAGKRIILLANMKNPKNHLFAVKAFAFLQQHKNWTLHFVGKIYDDDYFSETKQLIDNLRLQNSIFFYDSRSDIFNILEQATIGILCSTSEGFPVTILEYGLAKLPVLSSNVGYCSEVVHDGTTGLLYEPTAIADFCSKLSNLISNETLRQQLGANLHDLVNEKYDEETVINNLLQIYKN